MARRDDEHLALIMEAEQAGLLAAADIGADTEWCGQCGDVAVRIFPGTTSLSRWLLRTDQGYIADSREPGGRLLGGVVLPIRLNPNDFPDYPATRVERVMRPAEAYAQEYWRVLRQHGVCAYVRADRSDCLAYWECIPQDCLAPSWCAVPAIRISTVMPRSTETRRVQPELDEDHTPSQTGA